VQNFILDNKHLIPLFCLFLKHSKVYIVKPIVVLLEFIINKICVDIFSIMLIICFNKYVTKIVTMGLIVNCQK